MSDGLFACSNTAGHRWERTGKHTAHWTDSHCGGCKPIGVPRQAEEKCANCGLIKWVWI